MTVRTQVPVADGAQVKVNFRVGTLPHQNRLWFINRQPPTTLDQLGALADGVRSWHQDQVMPWLASQASLYSVLAEDWSSLPSIGAVEAFSSAVGGNSSGCHSANVSVLVRFVSSSRPPFIYNWNHVPGIPLDAVSTNIVETYFKDALFDAYVNLIDLAPVFGPFPAWRWVCASSIDAGDYRTEQLVLRTDFIQFPSAYVSPFRQRLKYARPPYV